MIRLPLRLFGIYVALVLDAMAATPIAGAEIHWLAVAASLCLWELRLPSGVLLAGLCGLLLDGLSANAPGLQTALLAGLAWSLGTLRLHQRWTSTAMLIVVTFPVAFLSALATELAGHPMSEWTWAAMQPIGWTLAGPAAATALVTGLLHALGRAVDTVCGWLLPPVLWRRPAET